MISFFHSSALLTEGQRGGHCHVMSSAHWRGKTSLNIFPLDFTEEE